MSSSTTTAPEPYVSKDKVLRAGREALSVSGGARDGAGGVHLATVQRRRLLVAMVEVSAEHGAANVTVAHVVERAGVSRRTFYELFSDREECFLAAFDDGILRASRYVLATYDPEADWVERIRSALTGLLSFLDVERDTCRLLIVGSLGAGAEVFERRRRVLAQMIAVIDQGRNETQASQELPPLTAEGILGGALSVLHSRLQGPDAGTLLELANPLMSMIVLPYGGAAAARKELAKPVPRPAPAGAATGADVLRDLRMRLTYRTIRVLMAVAARPGGSNRQVADASEITDQGQISKLLARLHGLGLIENVEAGFVRGAPNSWVLTGRGWEVQGAIARQTVAS